MRKKPILIYDGDCRFCTTWIKLWQNLTGKLVDYEPYQTACAKHPEVPEEACQRSVQLLLPSGKRYSGAEAIFRSLAYNPKKKKWMNAYQKVPFVAPITEFFYSSIAKNRKYLHGFSMFLFGANPTPSTYTLTSFFFLKGLAIVYLIAFVSFGVQALGLIGQNGILPVGDFMGAVKGRFGAVRGMWQVPGLFWFSSSDLMIKVICVLGVVFSLTLLFGFASRVSLIVLFILYLTVVNGGQTFMSFQWDLLLLEVGFLAIFISSNSSIMVWLFRWLLFRLMFMSGLVKILSGDIAWRDFSALKLHYWTQPLPTALAYYIHKLPLWFHKLSTLIMFGLELIIPLLFFAPRNLRMFAGWTTIGFMILIFVTGNYTFFTLLTIVLVIFLFDDKAISKVIPDSWVNWINVNGTVVLPTFVTQYALPTIAIAIAVTSIFYLTVRVTSNRLPGSQFVFRSIQGFHIVNPYGLFAVMTPDRPEIIIEGSNDGENWQAYEFKYKAGDLKHAPKWNQPHQPRLDWQMWFAALGNTQQNPWFSRLLLKMLEGSPQVLSLLEKNPFPNNPPKFIRARLYEYEYSTLEEKKKDGAWWKRKLKGEYFPVVSLQQP
jgi:lipase maturation factor 1